MSGVRDVIAGATGINGTWSAATKAGFILEALAAAGYRLIGPDEVDPVTVERCVSIAASWRRPDAVRLAAGELTAQEMRTAQAVAGGIEAALRALTKAKP